MTERGLSRVRQALTDLSVLVVAAYAVMLPVFFGLGWLSELGAWGFRSSVVLSAALFLLAGFYMFVLLMFEEDWWDDFREQNRAYLTLAVLHLAGSPAAWLLGRSASG